MHLVLGCFYLWGNIQVYVTSYLHVRHEDVSLNSTIIVLPMITILQTLFMPVGPLLLKRFPPYVPLGLGAALICTGTFLSSYATSLVGFVFAFGACFGAGIGLCYLPPMICGWEYFPNRKGFVSGVVICGFGLGSFIFSFVALALVNPDKAGATEPVPGGRIFPAGSPQAESSPRMLRILAIIWAALSMVAIALIQRKSTGSGGPGEVDPLLQNADSDKEQELEELGTRDQTEEGAFITFKEGVKALITWHIWIMIVLCGGYGLFLASVFKSYGSDTFTDSEAFLTTVGSLAGILNGLSRFFWAALQDKLGFKRVCMMMLSGQVILSATLELVHENKALYLIWICLSFFFYGAYFSIFPAMVGKIYGATTSGKIYPVVFSGFCFTTILGIVLAKTL